MTGKRPHDPLDADGDAKRVRSIDGSPVPASKPPNTNGVSDVERKKQEVAARLAAMKAKMAANKPNRQSEVPVPLLRQVESASTPSGPARTGPADTDAKRADAMRKIAEVKARMEAQRNKAAGSPIGGAVATPPPPQEQQTKAPSDVQIRIAEARAKAAELARQRNSAPSAPTPPPREEGRSARGGLGIGLHPSLLADAGAQTTTRGSQGPKFSTTMGNKATARAKINPYLAAEDVGEARHQRVEAGAFDPSIAHRGGERKSKALVFAPKGKYIAQATALKQQAKLEEMKRRLAIEARKVEIEEASDKCFLVPEPPEVEWWDQGLLSQDSYEDWDKPGRNKIDTPDSIITHYIQHPVLLTPPQDKFAPAPKPMMLTQQETKKLRRQRRMADMKEEQAKIRLGLVEPPPPKVKKSNMMRVFGEQAVKDPTAVEARVNREIAQRANDHEKANADRQLTKEQRAEKLRQQQAADEAKGVKIAVFRVDSLSSGKHRYQIDVNAKQNNLSGIVVLHPQMNLVIVEGGTHSVNAYKKLMLNRVKWAENTMPLSSNSSSTFASSSRPDPAKDSGQEPDPAQTWLNPLTERGELKDLSENQCLLVWEGDERQRSFRKWGSRVCETDGEARDALGRSKMENMWALAKGITS